jgi:superfamily I DNA/RNA helicase
MNDYPDRDHQFEALVDNINTQLKAYPGASIGVIASTNKTIEELRNRFELSPLAGLIAYHDIDEPEHGFSSGKKIHVLTAHASKGTEFRAVHMYGIEEFVYPRNRRELLYTAVTRAKTSLTAYRTGCVLAFLESAFAKPTVTSVKDIF